MEGKEEEGDFRKRNQVKKEKKKEERTWFEKDLKGKESSRKQEYKRLKYKIRDERQGQKQKLVLPLDLRRKYQKVALV